MMHGSWAMQRDLADHEHFRDEDTSSEGEEEHAVSMVIDVESQGDGLAQERSYGEKKRKKRRRYAPASKIHALALKHCM